MDNSFDDLSLLIYKVGNIFYSNPTTELLLIELFILLFLFAYNVYHKTKYNSWYYDFVTFLKITCLTSLMGYNVIIGMTVGYCIFILDSRKEALSKIENTK